MTTLRRLVGASATTNLADGIAVVAWGWVASLLTRDALPVARVRVALAFPGAALALGLAMLMVAGLEGGAGRGDRAPARPGRWSCASRRRKSRALSGT